MFDSLIQFIENLADGGQPPPTYTYEQKVLAISALLYRMVSIDGIERESERVELRSLLLDKFDIEPDKLENLIKQAWQEHKETAGLFPFTSIINHQYAPEQRIEVLNAMWSIAVSDQELHEFEENLIERVSELLEVKFERPVG